MAENTISIWEVGNLIIPPHVEVTPKICREALAQGQIYLKEQFETGVRADSLVQLRAAFVDEVLARLWQQMVGEDCPACLIATGGYGRGELLPYSDIDVLILLDVSIADSPPDELSHFLTALWDIGLEIGQGVRTLDECKEQAEKDVTVATNMLETRYLSGTKTLFEELKQLTVTNSSWDTRHFFELKKKEQFNRHNKYNDTANNLEPNIKECPGGLRDIQVISWVAQQHFGVKDLEGLRQKGFLANSEYQTLDKAQQFLWKIRFALHTLVNRKQDKLMFDHQRQLAKQFGYQDTPSRLAVEQFMKDYYRCARSVQQMNVLLLQLFEETIVLSDEPREIAPINRRFQSHNGYLETINSGIFAYYPYALLEVFLLLQQNPELKGIRASTIRQIHAHHYVIDDRFRADIKTRSLFMEILRQPKGLTDVFRQMNELGVLGTYLPEFGRIIGQMQHDLFHAYTVDEHTLFLVRNLRRFSCQEFREEFPLCSDVFQLLPKPELLYIAGIYHDIAKGRGGDHSVLGEVDARMFCQNHDISSYDTDLVCFLVRQHLSMSATAQKADLEDPAVIKRFAKTVGKVERLNYLYLLTVADIRATNNNLWNGWRDSLLRRLYNATRQWLENEEVQYKSAQENSEKTYQAAFKELVKLGHSELALTRLWQHYDLEYFLRHTVDEIVWQTSERLSHQSDEPQVSIRHHNEKDTLEIFVVTEDKAGVFAAITSSLEKCQLNVLDAKINITNNNEALNNFIVNEVKLLPTEIKAMIEKKLDFSAPIEAYKPAHIPRTKKLFKTKPNLIFETNKELNHTVMALYTHDRPGLISAIAQVFLKCNIQVRSAKLATLGDQVEDTFILVNTEGFALNNEQTSELKKALEQELSPEMNKQSQLKPKPSNN